MAPLVALWKGDIPLDQAFWGYAIVFGTIANIVATAAAMVAVAADLPAAVAVGLFMVPVPYIFIAVVGVMRSAKKYRAPPGWARMAKIAVIMWGAAMIVI